jgi:activating signal cointegrator complex subunit 3
VYIAPLKSLARERLNEWQKRFGSAPLKWSVLELSGDTHHDQIALDRADILVCTPEKWDLISRGWRGTAGNFRDSSVSSGRAFVKQVKLLVVDEIHLLGEDRGAVLEAIVSRTRFISRWLQEAKRRDAVDTSPGASQEYTRIVGLSTALANPIDLADWIGIDTKNHGPKAMQGLFNFPSTVRPVPMIVHVQVGIMMTSCRLRFYVSHISQCFINRRATQVATM